MVTMYFLLNVFVYCMLMIRLTVELIHALIFLGRAVDGREITVQFAKYGPNAERM